MAVKLPNPKYIAKPYEQIKYPGQCVQIDVKFVYHQPVSLVKQKARNFINIQAIDEYSRYRYLEAFEEHSTYFYEIFLEHLVESFLYAIECVQTDRLNSRISEGKILFEVILDKLGIRHKLIKLYTLGYNWQSETFSSQRLIKNFMLNIHFISSMISKSNWWLEIVNAIIFQCVL